MHDDQRVAFWDVLIDLSDSVCRWRISLHDSLWVTLDNKRQVVSQTGRGFYRWGNPGVPATVT